MKYLIVGLGNPGDEYEHTRHNVGRDVVTAFAEKMDFNAFEKESKATALIAKGKITSNIVECVLPETFMNKSGLAVAYMAKVRKIRPEYVVVVHDDLDIPLGSFKISFDRGSGGHRGIDSVMKQLKTRAFIRIRVGVTPTTPTGKLRKPQGEEKVIKFILGKVVKDDALALKKVTKKIIEALESIVLEGRAHAMNVYN
ncbi:aminoacyl-tRNA hydrolase [Candidatus Campbellbacteria bacterium]|nr:MAG: aminoacyl-tRNA hydrolase [Candidatus Campbellbacteria bacterium]